MILQKIVAFVRGKGLDSLDLDALDLHCLDPKTDSIQDLMQALIARSCQTSSASTEERYCAGDAAVFYQLPACLQYEEELTGNVISELSPKTYAEYVAGAYCELATKHKNLEDQFNTLSEQVKLLQRTVRTLSC